MIFSNFTNNGRPYPCALILGITMQSSKPIEYSFGIALFKADTVITDLYYCCWFSFSDNGKRASIPEVFSEVIFINGITSVL